MAHSQDVHTVYGIAMHEDELKQTIRDIYSKFDRLEQALTKLLEVELNQSYLTKQLAALEERLDIVDKELGNWRVARIVLIGVGVVVAPIFVAGITKVLGWH